jgi:hypothetical protein
MLGARGLRKQRPARKGRGSARLRHRGRDERRIWGRGAARLGAMDGNRSCRGVAVPWGGEE